MTILRIFDTPPFTLLPSGNQTVQTEELVLTWEPFTELYFFTYTTRIFEDVSNDIVWENSEIESTAESDTVAILLDDGSYYWRIAVVDEYGNSSLSEAALFRISP